MSDASRTTTLLLEGLLDPANVAVWTEFDERYRPVVQAVARRLGLDDHDAADVAQETMTVFLRDYQAGKYDRTRGRLGAWIVGIARHRIAELRRARARRQEWRGDSAVSELPGADELVDWWEHECRAEVLRRALHLLRTRTRFDAATIRAFEQVAIEDRAPGDVASELAISLDAVYAARSRCTAQLRVFLGELHRAYELD
ncbi:MAG: RNA polymerase sigma factor [Phycisphaerae bacterium]